MPAGKNESELKVMSDTLCPEISVTSADVGAPETVAFPTDLETPLRSAKILIVDDVPVNIRLLQAHLTMAGYEQCTGVSDATKVIAAVYQQNPDLLLLDIMMPEVSGLDILATLRSDDRFRYLPVLVLTASDCRETKQQALALGATDFLPKPVDVEELIPRVRNALFVKHHQETLQEQVRERTKQLEYAQQELVRCLGRAAEYRDNETGNHVIRVGCFAGIIAEELGLPRDHVGMIRQAATLHDLGKLGVPDSILLKPGSLTQEERELMQQHCAIGKSICEPLSGEESKMLGNHTTYGAEILRGCTSPLMQLAATIALTHHEWWDGTGYPLGLKGEDIPLEGRITAVADVFDALSSRRPYKPAFPLQECLETMESKRGTHFDPDVLDAFFTRREDIITVQMNHADVD